MNRSTKSNNESFSTFFHVVCAIYYVLVLAYSNWLMFTLNGMEELLKVDAVFNLIRFYPLYLTGWNVMFNALFFLLAAYHAYLVWTKADVEYLEKIRYTKEVCFNIVYPLTFIVAICFWLIYSYKKEYVYAKEVDHLIPRWFNHCCHTYVVPLIILEDWLQPRMQPTDRNMEMRIINYMMVSYSVIYYGMYFLFGRWLYPMCADMTWPLIILFHCGILVFGYAFYFGQFSVKKMIYGDRKAEKIN